MTKLQELANMGQAIWLDFIRRSLMTSGELQGLIDDGLRGMTSNPTIFEKAIAGSNDYDAALGELVAQGSTAEEIYETLTLEDIRRAADLLRAVYDETDGADGYVSLEVSPELAYDTQGTVVDARRLFAALERPNVLIKVPATKEGMPAIETLIGDGINVNVTLIFSLAQYEAAAEAYIGGLEKLAAADSERDLSHVASVASFFVSRVDTAVDRELEKIGSEELHGKIAIANSKEAYARFRQIFSGERWQRLAERGARVQRVLWASTSTKNPRYSDTLYVDGLIGPNTVNTVPPATLSAFRDHGTVDRTLEEGLEEARAQLKRLGELGIDLSAITQQLEDEGVAKFSASFESLMAAISEKRQRLLSSWDQPTINLGTYQSQVDEALSEMEQDGVVRGIWDRDHTVWKPEPEEITNRLGWLDIAERMTQELPRLQKLVEDVQAAGYTDALLLGMGGSSLAPAVFRRTFGVKEGYLDLAVLDSTDPEAVLAHAERLDPARTLFIVATKSGGTVETLSFFKFFYGWVADVLGLDRAGEHFVAITDPGTKLVELAERHDFRGTFVNDANIGGRYSALSFFGLLPAALVGVDVQLLLDNAMAMCCECESYLPAKDNPAAVLGATLGELAKAGRDKATFVVSPGIASFADWVEQLIAESTGKEGTGILPVVGEPLGPPEVYANDRLFIHLRLGDDKAHDAMLERLSQAGHPVVHINVRELHDLGRQVFLWELATAIAGYRLGINPFDQPNVEAAKVLARRMVTEYREKGKLPAGESAPASAQVLEDLVAQAQPGNETTGAGRSYVALQAYLQPTPELGAALESLRVRLRDRYRLATTVGYGPRFLHSTGQLHKGDAGNGLFVQFTGDSLRDAAIPDMAGETGATMTFGVLKMAQALGDRQALLDAGRRVIQVGLGEDAVGELQRLAEALR